MGLLQSNHATELRLWFVVVWTGYQNPLYEHIVSRSQTLPLQRKGLETLPYSSCSSTTGNPVLNWPLSKWMCFQFVVETWVTQLELKANTLFQSTSIRMHSLCFSFSAATLAAFFTALIPSNSRHLVQEGRKHISWK